MGKFDDLKQPKPTSSLGKLTLGTTPAPGIPGTRLPPRGAPPPLPPRIAPDAETPLPPVHARARRATETGLAPPAPGSAPGPSPAASLPPAPASQAPEPPRSITPPGTRLVANPYDPPTVTRRAREVAQRSGDTLEDAPQSAASDAPAAPEPPPWLTAKGLGAAAALVTATAGLVAALSAGVVQVIKAIREPTEGAKVKDIADAKKAGEECQTAVASERKATLAREEALAGRITAGESKTSELARRVPEVKPDPSRPPK